jgi:cyanophycinase
MMNKLACILSLSAVLSLNLHAQGSVLLVGGGSEDYGDWSDVPYRWLVQHAANKKVLVMHYSTTSSFIPGYFKSLGAVASSNCVVTSTASANDSAYYRTILSYDGIFLRGGDQWQYVSKWKGTLVEKAIKEVYQRGGVIGGTSAGEAVLSGLIFDARTTSVDPRDALQNPLASGITFTSDFLGLVPGVLADSHFFERGRIGRLLAMLPVYKSQTGVEITGIGIDANTAFGIGPDGVGVAMGSGTVTVLRFAPSTFYTVEASTPLSLRDMRLDQLTEGFTYDTKSGEIVPPQSAIPFVPTPFAQLTPTVILDGGSNIAEWAAPSGGLKLLQTLVNRAAGPVGIFSSPSTSTAASSVDSCLATWGISRILLEISETTRGSPAFAQECGGCSAFVFAGLNPDSAARLFDDSSAAGIAMRNAFSAGIPALYIANDVLLASDTTVANIESDIYAAYYGYMKLVKGVGVLKGVAVVPRLFEDPDYVDNRASALFWGLAKGRAAFGVMIDAGSSVTLEDGVLRAAGSTPTMVIDARSAHTTGFPGWIDPGKSQPRQNAALIGAKIHVIPPGDTIALALPASAPRDGQGPGIVPARFALDDNYPNPFNAETNIRYQISDIRYLRLAVYDLLGREVAVLVDEKKQPGSYEVKFDAPGLASGVYVCRMEAGQFVQARKLLLLR